MIGQALGEGRRSHTRKVQTHQASKKAKQLKGEVSAMLIIFYIKGIVHKEFVQTSQTVNSAYYCDVLRWLRENVRKLRPELWRRKDLVLHRQRTVSYSFTKEFSTKWNTIVVPYSLYSSPFPRLKINAKIRHFDTIEVIGTESQAVPNTTSRINFKNGRSAGNGSYAQRGTTWRVMVASRPKVSFWPDGAPVPEIMDHPLYSTSPGNYGSSFVQGVAS
jgi:hypothetical protein